MKTIITIKGMHCESCKAFIEDVCKEIPGIKSCSVDFKTGKTEIEYDEDSDLDLFKKEVEGLGQYKVELNT